MMAPTVRLAVTKAMVTCANASGIDRYPFHVDSRYSRRSDDDRPAGLPSAWGGTLKDMNGTPAGRPACNDRQPRVNEALSGCSQVPSVRLALGNSPPERNGTSGLEPPPSPTVRLATAEGGIAYPGGACFKGFTEGDASQRPALLVSYVYLKPFLANRHRYHYRDWSMDSGAYSAHNSGATIDLRAYGDCCLKLLAEDTTLTEVFSLDVIGDWKASLRNAEAMWARGIPAIPTFHPGEPWSALVGMARDYPKIALGGVVGWDQKRKIAFESVATDQMVVVSGIRVFSLCEHHLLPFWCDVAIGYVAADRVLGLSKFARVAHRFAHRLQVQERLTHEVADEVGRLTGSGDVAVLARGNHLCMSMRGVRTPAIMTTSVMRGVFRERPSARDEFLRLAMAPG